MIISDLVRYSKSHKICLPFFHRAPISIMRESSYTIVYFINKARRVFDKDHEERTEFEIPQVVITPIPFEEWPYLWKISVSVREKPGIIKEILRILEENKLNVLIETSYAVDLNQYHVIQLIVSASYYHGNMAQSNDIPYRIRVVREQILLQFMQELYVHNYTLDQSLEPAVYARPITRYSNLYDLYHDLYETENERSNYRKKRKLEENAKKQEGQDTQSESGDPEERQDEKKVPCSARCFKFALDDNFFEELLKHNGYARGDEYKYIIHTQSSTQQMSIYFPPRHRKIYVARIVHRDRIGAISSFSDSLSKNGFNLFSTLTRKKDQDQNHFEFVYEYRGSVSEDDARKMCLQEEDTPPPLDNPNLTSEEHKNRGFAPLIDYLLRSTDMDIYSPTIKYPPANPKKWNDGDWLPKIDKANGNSQGKSDAEQNKNSQENAGVAKGDCHKKPEVEDTQPLQSTMPKNYDRDEYRQKISQMITELEDQLAKTRNDTRRRYDLKARLQFARNLQLTATFAKPRVFISYRFDEMGENAVWFLRQVLEDTGFEVVIAKDLQNQYITDGVYGAIAECHFWVGVLTCADKTEDKCEEKDKPVTEADKRPSPWIQWEYGIARAHPSILERRLLSDHCIELEKNLIFREVPRFRTDNIRHMQRDIEKIGKEIATGFREKWETRFDINWQAEKRYSTFLPYL